MKRYDWARPGDVNAFFGLTLDNLAALILLVGLLHEAFGFPASFAMRFMVPGTALGVVFGDLIYTAMAFRLARRTGRNNATAMPLGIDTPSTFGMVFFVLGPVFLDAKQAGLAIEDAARHAWHVGMCALVLSGVFKLLCSLASGWIRRMVPRAGLLGSLAGIALVLISFLPLLDILHLPLVGFVVLGIILMTLVAKIETPIRIPGALAALLAGGVVYYAMVWGGFYEPEPTPFDPAQGLLPHEWLESLQFGWLAALDDSLRYLPLVIPFALATVIGGIDCTESAAAAGDEYHTGHIIAVEGVATLLAGCSGGVIQTTPYIGHPAYKAMGGRAAYTLATAALVGSAGLLGYFGYFYALIPKAAIFPVLVFIGLEITAQSFLATPRRHYPAVAIACLPALATLVMVFVDRVLPASGSDLARIAAVDALLARDLQTVRILANGFIVTSLLWGAAVAAMIDRRLPVAAGFFGTAAVCSLFGVIHSPLPGSPLLLPWELPEEAARLAGRQTPFFMAAGYATLALLLVIWRFWAPDQKPSVELAGNPD